MLALSSCWEFLFLDAAEPSCPSAPPTASLVPSLSFLKLSQGNVQGSKRFLVPVPLYWYVGCGFDCFSPVSPDDSSRFRAQPTAALFFVKAHIWLGKGETMQAQEAAGTSRRQQEPRPAVVLLPKQPPSPHGAECGCL